ncbi:zf-HC2 domain-containing protein [Streptomyces sp. WMMC905]|uniref:anti-sigma factor family protein n=1 Tax=Streptomyces sp. WMMC905 TaxID=3404123 RepID=UPI003B92660A
MSGSRPTPDGDLAEQHLGDRLAALVDGELGHDARERVLAHVATCVDCRDEVDAQRRLKSVFADAPPPGPSPSFLARLQGLADTAPVDGASGDGRSGHGGIGGWPGARDGLPTGGRRDRFAFAYVPVPDSRPTPEPAPADVGLRVHAIGRPDSDRPGSRGLRFVFVAAGAVSLAAVALGGVTLGTPEPAGDRSGSGSGSNVSPARTQGAGVGTVPDSSRRRSVPLLGQLQGRATPGDTPVAPLPVAAPLLPGVPTPPDRPVGSGSTGETTAATGPVVTAPTRPVDLRPPAPLAGPSPTTTRPPSPTYASTASPPQPGATPPRS